MSISLTLSKCTATPPGREVGPRPKGQLGQRRGLPLAYLLDLAEDGVCGLDLPFAQLPQGHLLEVNLWRQGIPLKARHCAE